MVLLFVFRCSVVAGFFLTLCCSVHAQSLWVGAQAGVSSVVTEAPTRPLRFLPRIHAIYEVNEQWSIEGGLMLGTVSSASPGTSVQWEFSSAIMASDIRARYVPLTLNGWKPFGYTGLGVMTSSTKDIPSNVQLTDVLSGTTVFLPLGVGLRKDITARFGAEFIVGNNFTFADDLNPLRDGKNDAFWTIMIGVSYRLTSSDTDGDGLSDDNEQLFRTNPTLADTDGDGLGDAEEVKNYMTNPLKIDSDGDGLTDQQEIFSFKTNPLVADTDGDGLMDGEEILSYLTDPINRDSDGDTLSDGDEVRIHKTSPTKADTDNDSLRDDEEILRTKTNPTLADTDGDGLNDSEELQKYRTNPLISDSDGGGAVDGVEIQRRTNPLDQRDDERALRPVNTTAQQQMQMLPQGGSMILEGIEFDVGKATIRASSEPILEAMYSSLMTVPDVVVEIAGHTDSDGKRDKNIALSQDRADAVKAWLVARGVDLKRLIARGYGPDRPIVENTTAQNKQRNRRIEFTRVK